MRQTKSLINSRTFYFTFLLKNKLKLNKTKQKEGRVCFNYFALQILCLKKTTFKKKKGKPQHINE